MNGLLLRSLLICIVSIQCLAADPSTRIVLLGTGAPRPTPERSGPATAIIVGDRAYLVDLGPGVARRAAAAARETPALDLKKITVAFVTHLHSDHTTGYPDLIFTGWMMGREALDVYGPAGIESMTKHLLEAWSDDIDIRTKGLEHKPPLVVHAHDTQPGVIYKDEKVTVTAFQVAHGQWAHAFGYRFDTPDRSIVISGDTSPSAELVSHCQPCDVLIHEAYSPSVVVPTMPDWPAYSAQYHTSTKQLAELANRAKPGLLIVYHQSGRTPDDQILKEIQSGYKGKVVMGQDLTSY